MEWQRALEDKMMKQSERYKELKAAGKSEKEIEKVFNQKIQMTVFSYGGDKSNQLDTLMSPLDSLRYYLQIVQVGFMAADAKTGAFKTTT